LIYQSSNKNTNDVNNNFNINKSKYEKEDIYSYQKYATLTDTNENDLNEMNLNEFSVNKDNNNIINSKNIKNGYISKMQIPKGHKRSNSSNIYKI
jgi:hypothetical protein